MRSWPNRFLSDCGHTRLDGIFCRDADCVWPCDRCDAEGYTTAHVHCDDCGATRCHGWWWRLKHPLPPKDPHDTRSGLDRARDAVRAARGGEAPARIRGYA